MGVLCILLEISYIFSLSLWKMQDPNVFCSSERRKKGEWEHPGDEASAKKEEILERKISRRNQKTHAHFYTLHFSCTAESSVRYDLVQTNIHLQLLLWNGTVVQCFLLLQIPQNWSIRRTTLHHLFSSLISCHLSDILNLLRIIFFLNSSSSSENRKSVD